MLANTDRTSVKPPTATWVLAALLLLLGTGSSLAKANSGGFEQQNMTVAAFFVCLALILVVTTVIVSVAATKFLCGLLLYLRTSPSTRQAISSHSTARVCACGVMFYVLALLPLVALSILSSMISSKFPFSTAGVISSLSVVCFGVLLDRQQETSFPYVHASSGLLVAIFSTLGFAMFRMWGFAETNMPTFYSERDLQLLIMMAFASLLGISALIITVRTSAAELIRWDEEENASGAESGQRDDNSPIEIGSIGYERLEPLLSRDQMANSIQ